MVQPAASNTALQRLVMITTVLSAAGASGRPALELADLAGYRGTPESRRESLARDIRRLRDLGIEIENIAAAGDESRWVLHPHDSRIRLAFTPEERAELARAAMLAGRTAIVAELADPASGSAGVDSDAVVIRQPDPPADLEGVLRAAAARCALSFEYNGRRRQVAPVSVTNDAGGWTVSGWDHTAGGERTFAVSRIRDLTIGAPGSARTAPVTPRRGRDPLTWPLDPPVTAVVRTSTEHERDVADLLGAGAPERDGTAVTFEIVVTNRWVFLARIFELGERAVLVGPDELRGELRQWLLDAVAVGQ